MNIKQITYLAAVIEHGSLSAAAKGQYVTVQAVSKAIADLERELGQSLFVRESRGVHPTPFGKAPAWPMRPVAPATWPRPWSVRPPWPPIRPDRC